MGVSLESKLKGVTPVISIDCLIQSRTVLKSKDV